MVDHFYDVQKMLQDDAEDLLKRSDQLLDKWKTDQENNDRLLAQSDKKLAETEAWLESIGIDVASIKKEAAIKGKIEADKMIAENEKEIAVFLAKTPAEIVTYDDLVERAIKRGYTNTSIQDLLTEDEIRIADERFIAINKEFSRETKLTKTDIIFLATATALQVIRQYVLDPWLKEQRKNAKSNDEKAHGKQDSGWYWVDTDKILVNTVPFDVNRRGNYETVQDFLKGHKNHREATLGHDPILGWVFGTMNIMTGTITNSTFQTAHVKYVPGKGNVIHSMASTGTMVTKVQDRVLNDGKDGKIALGYALLREAMHLKSDINTTHGLPLPLINAINPKMGETLAKYGIDAASVGTEVAFSVLINMIISMVHRIIKPEGEDEKLYEVRTRKILLYSNLIASTSNLVAVGVGAAVGTVSENPDLVKKSISYLDVGGLIVTIARLFSDVRFITKVKEEFIMNKLNEQLCDEIAQLDRLLEEM